LVWGCSVTAVPADSKTAISAGTCLTRRRQSSLRDRGETFTEIARSYPHQSWLSIAVLTV